MTEDCSTGVGWDVCKLPQEGNDVGALKLEQSCNNHVGVALEISRPKLLLGVLSSCSHLTIVVIAIVTMHTWSLPND